MQYTVNNYKNFFVNDIPLIDVRAPIEYKHGAFPNAVNLPIMDDHERKIVGTYYKSYGQKRAINKGYELVQGAIRENRIASWMNFFEQHPNGYLYCFRGGLRSKLTQKWLKNLGAEIPIVEGGYKALRTFLLSSLETSIPQTSFTLLGGKTGCGKTILINKLQNGIDIEAAAYHRGSSFGRHVTTQNTQINFENIIAIELLKKLNQRYLNIILEDEARTVGKVGLPKVLYESMRKAPLIVIEEPLDIRLERLIQEYIVEMHKEYVKYYGVEKGFIQFSSYLLDSLEKIQKRLGPARYGNIRQLMQKAISNQSKFKDISKHYDWLKEVLENYYDPMYQDQLNNKKQRIQFRGNYQACLQVLQQIYNKPEKQ